MQLLLPTLILLSFASSVHAGFVTLSSATTSVSAGTATTVGGFSNGTHTFQNGVEAISSISGGGITYAAEFGFSRAAATLKAGASVSKMYYFTGGTPIEGTSYTGKYTSTFNELFDTPFRINVGSDNTLADTYDSVRMWDSNRIRITNNDGLTKAGVSIIERGANDSNFRVRLITSLDGAENPNGYSDWYSVSGSDPFGSGLTINGSNANINYNIYQDTTSPFDGEYLDFHQNNSQRIGGVLITLDEFGQSIGDSFYGYEITIGTSGGRTGLDLIPGGGVFQADGVSGLSAMPEPTSLTLVMLGSCFTLFRCRRAANAD